jgi:hypothetical protein
MQEQNGALIGERRMFERFVLVLATVLPQCECDRLVALFRGFFRKDTGGAGSRAPGQGSVVLNLLERSVL